MRGNYCFDDRSYWRQRFVAAIALLQPGIDPVFLPVLSSHTGLLLADHGLVIASSQLGMAVGALVLAFARRLPSAALRLAAIGTVIASLSTVLVTGLAPLLAVRATFGFCNGLLYAAALSAAARRDPAHAMGTVLLLQLVLAAAVALLLPQIAALIGAGGALAALTVFAVANLWLVDPDCLAERDMVPLASEEPASGNTAAAAAAFLVVCASMMVWSYVGADAVEGGLSEVAVGAGVAAGSLAGCGAALGVALAGSRGWPPLPVLVGGGLASLAMLSPFVVPSNAIGFGAAMVAFNLGATYGVARLSAHAIERADRIRRLLPALQSSAMVAGPLLAAAAIHNGGFHRLAEASAAVLGTALVALVVDSWRASPVSSFDTASQQKESKFLV